MKDELRLELEAHGARELGELSRREQKRPSALGLFGEAAATTALAKPQTAWLWRRGAQEAARRPRSLTAGASDRIETVDTASWWTLRDKLTCGLEPRATRRGKAHRDRARRDRRLWQGAARQHRRAPNPLRPFGLSLHGRPAQPHGPYFQWTRKVEKKTVGRWLSAEQAADYRVFIENDRRLHELLARLEAIGIAALEADPRTRHKA